MKVTDTLLTVGRILVLAAIAAALCAVAWMGRYQIIVQDGELVRRVHRWTGRTYVLLDGTWIPRDTIESREPPPGTPPPPPRDPPPERDLTPQVTPPRAILL